MKKRNIKKLNSFFVSIFLFQYSLLAPVLDYVNQSLLIALSGIIIIVAIAFNNVYKNVNAFQVVFIVVFSLFLLLKIFASGSNFSSFINIMLIILPPSVLFLYKFDFESFLVYSFRLSILNYFVNLFYPFMPRYNYMRFGYAMLLTALFVYIELFYYPTLIKNRYKKIFLWVVLITSFIEIIIFGARGVIFAIMLFVFLDFFLINKQRITLNLVCILVVMLAYKMLAPILLLLEFVADKLGLFSYSLFKLRVQLSEGLVSSASGRATLYARSISAIKEHPIFGGKINVDENGGDYAHNIFLQVGQDLGVLALVVLLIFVIFIMVRLVKKNVAKEEKLIWLSLFSISIGRLMFSSTLWRRPDFWMLVGFCFTVVSMKYSDAIIRKVDIKLHNNVLEA